MVGSLITGGGDPTVKESELRRLGIWGTISGSGTGDESFTACVGHEFRIGVDELRRSKMLILRINTTMQKVWLKLIQKVHWLGFLK